MSNNIKNIFIDTIVTWFYLGKIRYFPGTFGSLGSLPFAVILMHFGGQAVLLSFSIIFFIIGIYLSDLYSKEINKDDPSEIVIDEVVGQWLVLCIVPINIKMYIISFILFRFFDILKPWPINIIEKKFKGGFGIMIDDILAAIYSIIVLIILNFTIS